MVMVERGWGAGERSLQVGGACGRRGLGKRASNGPEAPPASPATRRPEGNRRMGKQGLAPAWERAGSEPFRRAAVMLIDLEGMPQKEAAARSGVSLSGMKSRVQRGRQVLEHLLRDCCRIELDAGGRITDYQPRGDGCSPCATAGCDHDGDRTSVGAP